MIPAKFFFAKASKKSRRSLGEGGPYFKLTFGGRSRMKKWILITFLLLAALTLAVLFSYIKIFVYVFSKDYKLDISYKSAASNFKGELFFKDLSLVSKDTDIGFLAHKAAVNPYYSLKGMTLKFRLNDVKFIKKGSGEEPVKYDTLTALLTSPFNSRWNYSTISGEMTPTAKEMRIKDVEVVGEDIKVSLKGSMMYFTGLIDADIVIYFSDKLTSEIPPEMLGIILVNEKSGWKTLSVRLTGDLNKPAVQVSSKLFRLNIKAVGS